MNIDKIYAEQIASEYAQKNTTKVNQLKKLDKKAKMPAIVFAFSFGIISTLVLGTGMCLAMQVIGIGLASMIIGIIVGILGIAGCSVNYFIYKKLIEQGKQKYGNDIINLAKEISEEE